MKQEIQHSSQVISDYEILEPGQSDTWNPLHSEFELSYRLSLFYSLTQALNLSNIPVESLKVLDLGCGNGRSTRMYTDLGLMPEQLTGLDLRPGTIELAQKLNPAIHHMTYDGNSIPFADKSFNWISLTTVVSSIKSHDTRQHLADQIYQKLQPGGYLFYYDLVRANKFAGGERIFPEELFFEFKTVWHSHLQSYKFIPNLNLGNFVNEFRKCIKISSGFKQLIRPFLPVYTHEVLLVKKISG